MDVIEKMRRIVGPNNVLTGKEDILPYMRDASYLSGGEPLAVVIPGTTAELAGVVKACYEAEVPMYVRGGGTSLTGSSGPL